MKSILSWKATNLSLAENKIKIRLSNYSPNMETIYMEKENRKSTEPHKFVLNL